MRRLVHRALPVLFLNVLTGCAGPQIAPEVIQSIASVSISPEVKLPDTVYLDRHMERAGSGVYGVSIVAATIMEGMKERASEDAPAKIKAYLRSQNIDVAEIVRNEFLSGLKTDVRFSSKLGEQGRARFVLEVSTYGLWQELSSTPMTYEYKPVLSVKARLVLDDGKVVWESRAHSPLRGENLPRARLESYFDTPDTFRNGFKAAAQAVTEQLLKNL